MSKKFTIKNWAIEDRPREKLLAQGRRALSNAELIAILIGSGNKEDSAVELAKKILASVNNNLSELAQLSIADLCKNFKGIGEAKAISIVAALELGRRRKLSELIDKQQVTSSADAYDYIYPVLQDLQHEEFWVLFLNRASRVIDRVKVGQGGLTAVTIDLKLILKRALEKMATSIIICHNHPSGSLQPSEADIELTEKIKNAANLLEISLIDHLILADNRYYSFADNGML